MTHAPDFAEALQAWRVWRVVRLEGDLALASVVQRTVWPAGEELAAGCLAHQSLLDRLRKRPKHDAPQVDCCCGVYATDLEHVTRYLAEMSVWRATFVLGQVSLWGTVIECDRGFRASYAYPSRIYVPSYGRHGVEAEECVMGLLRYDVPVEKLAGPPAEAGRVLAERLAA